MSGYAGNELERFARATRWKTYWSGLISPFVSGRVLEVGAGIGSNIPYLARNASAWTALEQDVSLLRQAPAVQGPVPVRRVCGTIDALAPRPILDTVLYIDVLEHIEDDATEVARAAGLLAPGGHLVVLAPAWERLRSPFDDALGHYRRYNRSGLKRLHAPGLRIVALKFVDSFGMLASIGNRSVLRADSPTATQIATWDRFLIPLSRLADPLLGYRVGKSVICIWRKHAE